MDRYLPAEKQSSLLDVIKPSETDEIKSKDEIELPKYEFKEKNVEKQELKIIDPRLSLKGPERRKRTTFKFVKNGAYQKQAYIRRNTARLHLLQSEIDTTAGKQTGIPTVVKLFLVNSNLEQETSKDIPSIEWWDEHLLQKNNYDVLLSFNNHPLEQRYSSSITSLIDLPIQLKDPNDPVAPTALKVYLTKKERNKLCRQNRLGIHKEEAEQIRLGLKQPPEQNVTIKNMKVWSTDAALNPTKMEMHVREKMAERVKKHLKANADRKLINEETFIKKKKKIAKHTSLNVHVAVYNLISLADPSKKFKAEINAKQLGMTGVMIINKNINLVIVERGPKQHKFYKNLMLCIKWSEEECNAQNHTNGESKNKNVLKTFNECQIIWEGIVQNRAFNDFRVSKLQSPKQIREFLDKHGVNHYWDYAYSLSALLSKESV